MNDTIELTCPKCSQPMLLQRPTGPSQVACPKCGRAITISADGKISSATPQPSFTQLPPPLIVSAQAPRRRSSPAAPTTDTAPATQSSFDGFSSPYHQQRSNKPPTNFIPFSIKPFIVTAIVATVLLVGGMTFVAFKDSVTVQSWILRASGTDPHQSLCSEVPRVITDATRIVANVQDEKSRDTAANELEAVIQRCRDLTRTAAALPTLTEPELADLQTWVAQNVSNNRFAALKTELDASDRQRLFSTGKMKTQLNRFSFALGDLLTVYQTTMKPIAQPQTYEEQIEYEILLAYRQTWAAMYDISDSDDYQDLNRVFERSSKQLSSLRSQYKKLDRGGAVIRRNSPFAPAIAAMHVKQQARFRMLENQFGSLTRALAYQNYQADSVDFIGRDDSRIYELALEFERSGGLGDLKKSSEDVIAQSDSTPASVELGYQGRFDEQANQDRERELQNRIDRRPRNAAVELSMLDEARASRDSALEDEAFQEGITVKQLEARKRAERIAKQDEARAMDDRDDPQLASSGSNASAAETAFRRRHRGETITVVRISDAPPREELDVIEEDFRQEFRPDAISVRSMGSDAIVLLVYDGDLDEMAGGLYWGRLISVDAGAREIRVRYTDE